MVSEHSVHLALLRKWIITGSGDTHICYLIYIMRWHNKGRYVVFLWCDNEDNTMVSDALVSGVTWLLATVVLFM